MRIEMDERLYVGTALQIAQEWRERSFAPTRTVREYLEWACAQIGQAGVVVARDAEGLSDEKLAEALVRTYVEQGMAREVKG